MAQDNLSVDEKFVFTEADLISKPLTSTTWRERLSPILKKKLEASYGKDIAVWQAIAGRARILVAEKKEKHPAYSHSMLYFDHHRYSKEKYHRGFSYGLWVQKGVTPGCEYAKKYPDHIMGGDWSWARMLSRLEDERDRELFISIVEKNSFEIWLNPNNHPKVLFTVPAGGHGLVRGEGNNEERVISWEDFFYELRHLPADDTAEMLIYHYEEIGQDRKIDLLPVINDLSALMSIYNMGYGVESKEDWRFLNEELFLINALGPDETFPKRRSFLNLHGKTAIWFSYPIRDAYHHLTEGTTFPLLLYSKGELSHALRVVACQTSKGNEGNISPFEESTLKEERNKKKMGNTQAYICKTWCLVDRIEDIDPPLPLDFFEDDEEGKPLNPSAFRNSFGYARKRTSEGDMYQHFSKRGLYFSNETITNYYLSLKTKPFVIITGISGTGKTKIAQCFAEYMCPPEDIEVKELPENTDTGFFLRVNKNLRERGEIFSNKILAEYFDVPEKGKRIDLVAEYADQEEPSRINSIGWTDPTRREQLFLSLRKGAKSWIQDNFQLGDIVKFAVLNEERTRFRIEKVTPSVKKSHVANRLAFISVRPDWMDNRGLLGFYNLLTGAYQPSELLKIMLRAKDDPDRPYFVILDEMNLAKVEYYFSDFLSCLESRMEGEDGNVSQEPIYLHDQEEDLEYIDETGATYYIPPSIRIPTNLYFTGTVNIDETTYMFSPKVLDRANTIEFNEVDLAGYGAGRALTNKAGIRLQKGVDARSQFPGFELGSAYHYRSLDATTRDDLEAINAILADYHLHFGYRVANEIALYMKNAQELTGNENMNASLDLQILQKVLPKFHGSRQKLEEPLLRLFAFCFDETPEEEDYHSFLESHAGAIESARFTRSARKIKRMLEVLGDQGFASFVE